MIKHSLWLGLLLCTPLWGAEQSKIVSPSNDITLREYVDVRFAAQEQAVSAALAAAKEAVAKAETSSDKRFESVNEFRNTLSDQARTLMPRSEAENQFKVLNEKLDTLTSRINARENQSEGLSTGWAYVVGAIGIAGAVTGIIFSIRRRA